MSLSLSLVSKILFLDIDDVMITSNQYFSKKLHPKYNCYPFDKKCVTVLNEIIDKTGADIILSSDWKYHYTIDQLNEIFKDNGINYPVINITTSLWETKFKSYSELHNCRAEEILDYVEKHEIVNYAAVDDLNLLGWIPNNFAYCARASEGIKQTGIKEKIINILNKK